MWMLGLALHPSVHCDINVNYLLANWPSGWLGVKHLLMKACGVSRASILCGSIVLGTKHQGVSKAFQTIVVLSTWCSSVSRITLSVCLSHLISRIALFKATRSAIRLGKCLSACHVYGHTVSFSHSAKVPLLVRMPLTNKSKNADCGAALTTGSDRGEAHQPSQPREQDVPPEDGGGGEDNQGDPEIIKSPSDPKQYR